jgi:CRP-like cAMP-binding protein
MDESKLSSVPLFQSLSKRERKEVARLADEVDLREGKHLVDEGDFAYEFFVIENGSAEVVKDGAHVADLGAGDFLGEMGAISHAQRGASVIATSPVTAIVMTAQDLRHIARDLPDVGRKIEAAIEERTRATAS